MLSKIIIRPNTVLLYILLSKINQFSFYSGEGNSFNSLSLLAGSPEFPAKSQLFYYNLKDSFVFHPEFNLSSPQNDLAILEVNMGYNVIDNKSLSVGLARYVCPILS